MYSHRAAYKGLPTIGRVLSHEAYLVITAPADEYFGQTKLSPLGVRNELTRIGNYLDAGWGDRTAVTLPGLTTTPRDMAAAMDRVAGYAASDLIDWTDDPVIGAIVGSWPARFETRRAHALGLRPDRSFDDIVREYISGQRP